MSTRSDIIVHRADGKWSRVYCHWDGYLDHNGALLAGHYASQELAEALVAPGDMSSLHEKCDKPKGHSYDTPVDGHTVYYYGREGEKEVDAKIFDSLREAWPSEGSWTEYTYVWDDGKWWVGDPDDSQSLILLSDALDGKKTIHPNIKAFGIVIGKHA